ncbi:MAG: Arc family DNA-binding protein [Ruminococcus sp.]|nr:Arc family DNA-binding protein [Ruminococcus sp.]
MVTFNLRLSDEVNEKIVKIAQEEKRSKNQEIEFILSEYIKQHEEKEKNK